MCPAGILNREQSMNTQAELVRDRSKQASVLKIIDCDVHPTVRGGIASIYPYMPEAWSRRFIRKNASMASIALTTKTREMKKERLVEVTRAK
jgi:hypothetical protein